MTRAQQPRIFNRVFLLVGVGIVAGVGLTLPVGTRQGMNFQVSRYEIPLYVKAIDFLNRHYQYQRLTEQITQGLHSDHERVLAVFDWTRQHIRKTPSGWPIVDDHILNIIIRGYGLEDQMADVFTTLCTYAGVPAFWRSLRIQEGTGWLIFSFARVDGKWVMFDVGGNVTFANAKGNWLDATELLENPAQQATISKLKTPEGVVYQHYLERLRPFRVPAILRAQKQMPWPRFVFEIRRVFHLETDAPVRPDINIVWTREGTS